MYILQSVLHSLITLFIVEMAIEIWEVRTPLARFRYRLSVIVLPVFMFPLFQVLNPGRGSFYFREDTAVFDGMRWLGIELWGKVPLGIIFFFFIVVATTVIVFFQEIIPVIKSSLPKKQDLALLPPPLAIQDMVEELAKPLRLPKPPLWVIDDEDPVIFTSGVKTPAIVISMSLIEMLDKKQMRSALAHELAHIIRRSNITTFLVFILRIFMFYNPVSLLVFRRIVQDDEHICDDITVSMTGDPHMLASTLRAFYMSPAEGPHKLWSMKDVIESASHNLLLEERVTRLEEGHALEADTNGWGRYVLTMTVAIAINYFIV